MIVRFELFHSLNEAKLHSHINYEGLNLSIEVPAGSYRRGTNKKTGEEWKMLVSASYGYIKGTHSPDGEHLDCYLRKNPKHGAKVYVIHQMCVDGGKFDEDKVMLGYSNQDEAVRAFKKMTFKPSTMYGGVSEFTMDHFKLAAYSASKSKAMLTSEDNYDKFKRKGHLPAGIKSPVSIAMRISEQLSLGLGEIAEELVALDMPDPMSIDDEPDQNLVLIHYDQYTDLEAAEQFANQHGIECERNYDSGMALAFFDENHFETFIQAVDIGGSVEMMGDMAAALETIMPVEPAEETFEDMEIPMDTNEGYVVVVHTQIMENFGSSDVPSWGTAGSKTVLVQEGLTTYGEARSIAARVSAGIIPIELQEGALVMGIEVLPIGEYRQFHESENSADSDDDLDTDDVCNEDTTEDVFFAQQVQETQTLAGVHPEPIEPQSGTPTVQQTRARLEALTQQFYEQLDQQEPAVQFPADKVTEAVQIISETQKINPGSSLQSVAKAVCKKVYGNVDLAESLMEQVSERGLLN